MINPANILKQKRKRVWYIIGRIRDSAVPPPGDNWLLTGGTYADSGVWVDGNVWID